MNVRRIGILIAMTLALSMLLGSCGAAGSSGTTGTGLPAGTDLMAAVRAAKRPENPSGPDRAFVESVGTFSWTLFQKVSEQKGNLTLSPASAYLALAMTLNGAGGETRADMLLTMAASGLSVGTINTACRDWMTLMMKPDDEYGGKAEYRTDLKIANSIWYKGDFAADPAFLQANADYFAAAARQLDFADRNTVKVINAWVEQATSGKIQSIMERIEPDEVLYLINAVYFKSLWQKQFQSRNTHPGDFFAENGTVSASYLNDERRAPTLDMDGMRGVLLPFLNPRFAFMAVLAPEGSSIRQAISRMDAAAFEQLLNTRRETTVTLDIPKFDATYETDLLSILASLGMSRAFNSGADFSLMEKGRSRTLSITGVRHKTFFKIDEYGAEAAGVTGVSAASAVIRQDESHLVFDRPFLYGIVDVDTGLPLFLGILDNPTR